MNTLRCASRIGKLLRCGTTGDEDKVSSSGAVAGECHSHQRANNSTQSSVKSGSILTNYLNPIGRSLTSLANPIGRTLSRRGSLVDDKGRELKTVNKLFTSEGAHSKKKWFTTAGSSSNLLAKYRVSSAIDLRTIGMKPLSSFDWFNYRRASSANLNFTSKLPDSPEVSSISSNLLTARSVQRNHKSRRNALVPIV